MEQFSLEKHLENPSRKVVTREGRPVRIVCWDLKSNTPIIAAIQWNQEREDCYCYNTIGRCANNIGELDLFFADEEKELTEFEKAIKKLIESCCNEVEEANITNAGAKEISSHILDLARKEILKSLPKWKKCVGSTGPFIDDFRGEDYLYLKDYVIKVSELFEKLPKEE